MARASERFGNAFAWGATAWGGNGGAPGRRTKPRPAVRAAVRGPSVRVEPLEGRTLMAVTLVSANVGGQAGGPGVHSRDPEISDDGRYVVYVSSQTDVVGGVTDTNDDTDVFVRDLATNTSTLVSGRADNIAFGGFQPTISGDGRYVAFVTDEKLVGPDNAPGDDVYVWDRQNPGTFTLASARTSDGEAVTGIQPSISSNGRVVAFVTDRPGDTIAAGTTDANTARDVFVRNLDTNTTVLASATPGGTAAANAESTNPQISGDGSTVVFISDATDLVAGVTVPGTGDAYRRVLSATQADLVSVTAGSTPAGGGASAVSVDDNGDRVAFSSGSVNIVSGDTNGVVDIFVRDMTGAGSTTVVSTTPGGERNDQNAAAPSISGDGNSVAFASSSRNLVEPDPGTADIFVKSLVDGSIRRVSWTDPGNTQPNFGASFPSIDADGNAVAFISQANDLVPNTEPVAEQDEDVFAWTAAPVVPPESVAPTAAVTTTNVTTAGGVTHTVQVIYSDNVAVDVSSISSDDITVTGPGAGGAALAVSAVQINPTTNGSPITATYTIDAPGGTWDAADDGAYTVTLNAGAVRDTAGNTVATQTATFTVGTATPPPPTDGPDLVAAIVPGARGLPASVVGGAKGNVRVQLTNNGNAPVDGTAAVALLARGADAATQGAGDITLVTTPDRRIRLRPGQSRFIPVRFTYPTGAPDGAYNLVAVADPGRTIVEGSDLNNEGVSATSVTVAAPFVDLAAVDVGAPPRGTITAGRRTPVPVTVENLGNTPGTGTLRIDIYASTISNTTIATGEDVLLGTITRPLRLRNGQRRVFRVTLPGDVALPAGQYFLTAVLVPEGLTDTNPDNNTAVSGSQFPVA